jgi:hypothetical protein
MICFNEMRNGEESDDNLFARLTSLTAEAESNRIENFCTECLAWSLRSSPNFRASFLGLLGVSAGRHFDIKTQETLEDHPTYVKLDVVLEPSSKSYEVLVVEVKVWDKLGAAQISRYRRVADRNYQVKRGFGGVRLVSLTPFGEKVEGTDLNVSWSQIAELLRSIPDKERFHPMLVQFADFLQCRGLATMKLEKFSPEFLAHVHEVASFQQQLKETLRSFKNSPTLKNAFGTKIATVDFHADVKNERSWIGIHSPKDELYAGFGFIKGTAVLWVELTLTGDHRSKISKIPKSLQSSFENARQFYVDGTDPDWVISDRANRAQSIFVFVEAISSKFDGEAGAILRWFEQAIKACKEFVEKLPT